ncbi:hypothetical protein CAXC1_90005 [Candidatus Xenohaliotis californiensis]|uniref:Type II secretion system protein G n=1 Tax=Candidatus Xenohaliotis californiensis TaxID=84677 RepID=A0ABM9N9H7_9RICK|nr:hypothetical protein CAXC1_90005 [Candidatus Xenohaliotis californiensis]
MQKKRGIVLIEILVVMIASMIVMGAMWNITNMRNMSYKADVTRDRIHYINNAIRAYVREHGYLPCPMISSLSYDDVDYGKESQCRDAKLPSKLISSGTDNELVLHGSVPFIDLGIPESYVYDSWDRRINYVVVAALTRSYDDFFGYMTKKNNGVISIIDKDKNNILDTSNQDVNAYILLSYGKGSFGAYDMSGSRKVCKSIALDGENCNDDSIFLVSDFNYALNPMSNKFDDYYDDIIDWSEFRDLYIIASSTHAAKTFTVPEQYRYFNTWGIIQYTSTLNVSYNGLYVIDNAQSSDVIKQFNPLDQKTDFAVILRHTAGFEFYSCLNVGDIFMVHGIGHFKVESPTTLRFIINNNIVHSITKNTTESGFFLSDAAVSEGINYRPHKNSSIVASNEDSLFLDSDNYHTMYFNKSSKKWSTAY